MLTPKWLLFTFKAIQQIIGLVDISLQLDVWLQREYKKFDLKSPTFPFENEGKEMNTS